MNIVPFLLLICFSLNAAATSGFQSVGKTRLEVLFWSVYDIELLTPDGFYAPNRFPVRLKITYLRDFKARSLVKRTGEEWEKQGISPPKAKQWFKALNQIWPDISENDSLELQVNCDQISHFYFNGKLVGSINDKDFAPAFLAIWLSENTSQPRMRAALLAEKTINLSENSICR